MFIYLFIYLYLYILPSVLCPADLSCALLCHPKSLAELVGTFTHLAAVSLLETILAGYAHHARHICRTCHTCRTCLVSMLAIW